MRLGSIDSPSVLSVSSVVNSAGFGFKTIQYAAYPTAGWNRALFKMTPGTAGKSSADLPPWRIEGGVLVWNQKESKL